MSNYTKSTDFASKDSLPSGNSAKIVKGTEIDTEFNNIATAVATKADTSSPTFTGTPSLPTGTIAVTQSTADDSTKLATTAFVQDIAAIVKAALYPVGSIYTNASSSTNPATLLGFGTWTAFGAGRVMVGLDAGNSLFDTVGETGGSADAVVVSHSHTLTGTAANESITGTYDTGFRLPGTTTTGALSVTLGGSVTSWGSSGSGSARIINLDATHDHTVSGTADTTGSSGTNANYQPYITVYMWRRTA
jgi:hypothetical protein